MRTLNHNLIIRTAPRLILCARAQVYGLKDKSVLKVFSVMFGCSVIDMQRDLDISGLLPETIVTFFEKNTQCTPASKSKVSLAEVDAFLAKLEVLSSQDVRFYTKPCALILSIMHLFTNCRQCLRGCLIYFAKSSR